MSLKELLTAVGTEKKSCPQVAPSLGGEKAKYTNNEIRAKSSKAEMYKMFLPLRVLTIMVSVEVHEGNSFVSISFKKEHDKACFLGFALLPTM